MGITHNQSTRERNMMAFKIYLHDLYSSCLFMPACPVLCGGVGADSSHTNRGPDQQVISTGRYQKKHKEAWK